MREEKRHFHIGFKARQTMASLLSTFHYFVVNELKIDAMHRITLFMVNLIMMRVTFIYVHRCCPMSLMNNMHSNRVQQMGLMKCENKNEYG